MSKVQRAFRYLWRANAVLILVAAGAITFGVGTLIVSEMRRKVVMRRQAEEGPPLGVQADPRMSLARASVVAGTRVMRAHLVMYRGGSGFSSGGYGDETRNILFIQPGEKAARWLLRDHQHVVTQSSDLVVSEGDPATQRMVATAALVKPATGEPEAGRGRLLLFDPPGSRVVEVADGVASLHVAGLASGEIALLFERDRRLVLATFDAGTLAERRQQDMEVPRVE